MAEAVLHVYPSRYSTMTLRSAFAGWEHWWTEPIPPHALAIVRIVTGAAIFLWAASHAPHLRLLFSADGVTIPFYADRVAPPWNSLLMPAPFWGTVALFVALLAGAACMAIGWHMRLSIATVIVSGLYFWQIYLHVFPATFHRLLIFVLIVLLCSGADRTLSLRMKSERGSWTAWEPVCALPQRLLMVQVCLTYLGSGWQKLGLTDWKTGEILAYSLLSDWGTPLARSFVRLNLPMAFYDAVVRSVLFFEFVLPFGLVWRPTQKWFFVLGITFHVLVLLLLSIWSFLVFLVPLYITLLPPEEVRKWRFPLRQPPDRQ